MGSHHWPPNCLLSLCLPWTCCGVKNPTGGSVGSSSLSCGSPKCSTSTLFGVTKTPAGPAGRVWGLGFFFFVVLFQPQPAPLTPSSSLCAGRARLGALLSQFFFPYLKKNPRFDPKRCSIQNIALLTPRSSFFIKNTPNTAACKQRLRPEFGVPTMARRDLGWDLGWDSGVPKMRWGGMAR